ncbi:hypothetical protein IFR05_016661 [Cadophora sp. M221]|nr:hypothetical protein IFR05_016661 [Cadophora sp. M221]
MISSSPKSLPSSTYCIDPNFLPISKVSEALIAQPNTINTTIVSTATTPELELSLFPWPLPTLSPLVSAANYVDEGQLPEPNEYASDSGVSEGDSDDDLLLLSSYLEPKWHGSIRHALISNYPFPCSENELKVYEPWRYELISRLREHHGMNPLHFAPIDNHPHKIVDIGTSISLWANDVANVYRSAEVEGTNVNAIVLNEDTAPNVKFIQDDAKENWLYKGNSLDFVRASLLLNSIKDKPRLFG